MEGLLSTGPTPSSFNIFIILVELCSIVVMIALYRPEVALFGPKFGQMDSSHSHGGQLLQLEKQH